MSRGFMHHPFDVKIRRDFRNLTKVWSFFFFVNPFYGFTYKKIKECKYFSLLSTYWVNSQEQKKSDLYTLSWRFWIAIHLQLPYLLHSVSVYKKRCEISTSEALCTRLKNPNLFPFFLKLLKISVTFLINRYWEGQKILKDFSFIIIYQLLGF